MSVHILQRNAYIAYIAYTSDALVPYDTPALRDEKETVTSH